jgi:hypothetical protein
MKGGELEITIRAVNCLLNAALSGEAETVAIRSILLLCLMIV